MASENTWVKEVGQLHTPFQTRAQNAALDPKCHIRARTIGDFDKIAHRSHHFEGLIRATSTAPCLAGTSLAKTFQGKANKEHAGG